MKDEMITLAALVLALGILGGSYMLSQVDYSPKINVSDITSTPNVYVSSSNPDHQVTVSGTTTKRVSPDLLNINIRMETMDKIAKKSQEMNSEVSSSVINKLKTLGLTEDEIQSTWYNVQEVRESQSNCDTKGCVYDYVLVGYKTIHTINVRTTDLELAGDIVDSVSAFGENEVFIESVSFSLQEETRNKIQNELIVEAGKIAKVKAEAISSSLGAKLGKLLYASESYYYPYPMYYSKSIISESIDASIPGTSFEAGNVEVSVTVNAGFELN